MDPFQNFSERLLALIAQSGPVTSSAPTDEADFSSLAQDLFPLQCAHNPAYRRWCEHQGVRPERIGGWRDIPLVPTSAFKELELTSLPGAERTTFFLSSGTTNQNPSRHFHSNASLAIYEASLLPWFKSHLLADLDHLVEERMLGPLDRLPLLSLTPSPSDAPRSSLVHMLDSVLRHFGSRDSLFGGSVDAHVGWQLDMDRVLFAIRKSKGANKPVGLLGTAFNFVHLLDHLAANNVCYRLARGSRVMETGGYKGRSRELPRAELHELVTRHLGIPASHIVTEYGMCELSSQAYDRVVTATASGVFHFPPWARFRILSPESGREMPEGESGLLAIYDLANVYSVMAVQTEDLAERCGGGFRLVGRAPQTEPRGCSLMPAST